MPRSMNVQEWQALEAAVRQFCELRAEYRRRKEAGSLGAELDGRMIQALNALEVEIERMKSPNELARARTRKNAAAVERPALRKAQ